MFIVANIDFQVVKGPLITLFFSFFFFRFFDNFWSSTLWLWRRKVELNYPKKNYEIHHYITTESLCFYEWKHLNCIYKLILKYCDQIFVIAELTCFLHFRFEPAPVQVLLSEEITGSLRKLKVQWNFPQFQNFPCNHKCFFLMVLRFNKEHTWLLFVFKGCCTLTKDRYKSLEKRGLIVPTAKSRRSVDYPFYCVSHQ